MNGSDDKTQNEEYDDIPELTQTIPVLDQIIPVLTDRIDLKVKPLANLDNDNSSDTVEDQLHRHRHEIEPPKPTLIHESVSNQELEMQQWQIEQQADIQAGEWQELSNIESVATQKPELTVVASNVPDKPESSEDVVYLSDDVEAILHASWQRLEDLIMTQMPPEIAGAYLSLLEKRIYENKVALGKDLSLLDQDSLEELLDEFDIDRGF